MNWDMLKQDGVGLRNAQIVSIYPGIPKRNSLDLKIEVKVHDPDGLFKTIEAMEWLLGRDLKDGVDWDVNILGWYKYSTFYFKDQGLATEFALVFG